MDVRIVIATFNSEKLLKECLHSIYDNTINTKFELIIIDNASTDNTIKMLKDNFVSIKIIQNKKNFGVARSRNQGLNNNHARYVLI